MMKEFTNFWKRAFDFKGRARRREYWISYLWMMSISYILIGFSMLGVFAGIDMNTGELHGPGFIIGMIGLVISCIFMLVMFVPMLSLCVRRCHDVGITGWSYLFCILGCFVCGIGSIAWLVISFLDSKPETNKWGPNPKDPMHNEYQGGGSIGLAVGVFVASTILYIILIFAASVIPVLTSM